MQADDNKDNKREASDSEKKPKPEKKAKPDKKAADDASASSSAPVAVAVPTAAPLELIKIMPESGRAVGGTAVTVVAKGWPSAETKKKGGDGGPRCQFGKTPPVQATILSGESRSKKVGGGKRPPDETWLKCVSPAGAAGSSVPLQLAPNGADFVGGDKLAFRYDGAVEGSSGDLHGGGIVTAAAIGGGFVAVALLAAAGIGLYRTLKSSGWMSGTPAHHQIESSPGKASKGSINVRSSLVGAIEEEEFEDGLEEGVLVEGGGTSAGGVVDPPAPRTPKPSSLGIEVTTADEELASDLKRLLILAEAAEARSSKEDA